MICGINKKASRISSPTFQGRGKAEHIIGALSVLTAVASDARPVAGAAAGPPGVDNGILDCAVTQPASVAPVQAVSPGIKQLIGACNHGTLLGTGLHSVGEVQVVAASVGGVGEHNT